MAAKDDFVSLTEKLSLGRDGGQNRNQGDDRAESNTVTLLTQPVQTLLDTAGAVVSQIQPIMLLASKSAHADIQDFAQILLLHEQTKKLADVQSALANATEALTKLTEDSLILRLKSLGNLGGSITSDPALIRELLLHFDVKVRAIVQRVLTESQPEDVLWKIAEEGYKATAPFRCL